MLRDTADSRAIWLDERPALRVLLRYRASVQLLIVKLVVCHYGKQPRSERKGTDLITVSGQCCEVAWEHGGDAYVDASSCVHLTRSVTQLIDEQKSVVRVRKEAKWVWRRSLQQHGHRNTNISS